jgi:hypothetical protein
VANIARIGEAILAGLQQGTGAWQQQRKWKLEEPYRQAMIDKLQAELEQLELRNKMVAKFFVDGTSEVSQAQPPTPQETTTRIYPAEVVGEFGSSFPDESEWDKFGSAVERTPGTLETRPLTSPSPQPDINTILSDPDQSRVSPTARSSIGKVQNRLSGIGPPPPLQNPQLGAGLAPTPRGVPLTSALPTPSGDPREIVGNLRDMSPDRSQVSAMSPGVRIKSGPAMRQPPPATPTERGDPGRTSEEAQRAQQQDQGLSEQSIADFLPESPLRVKAPGIPSRPILRGLDGAKFGHIRHGPIGRTVVTPASPLAQATNIPQDGGGALMGGPSSITFDGRVIQQYHNNITPGMAQQLQMVGMPTEAYETNEWTEFNTIKDRHVETLNKPAEFTKIDTQSGGRPITRLIDTDQGNRTKAAAWLRKVEDPQLLHMWGLSREGLASVVGNWGDEGGIEYQVDSSEGPLQGAGTTIAPAINPSINSTVQIENPETGEIDSDNPEQFVNDMSALMNATPPEPGEFRLEEGLQPDGSYVFRTALSAKQQEDLFALVPLKTILDRIHNLSVKLNWTNAGAPAKLLGIFQKVGKWAGLNQDGIKLDSLRDAFAGLFARLGGETGRFTEGDIARAKAMIPHMMLTKDTTIWFTNMMRTLLNDKLMGVTLPTPDWLTTGITLMPTGNGQTPMGAASGGGGGVYDVDASIFGDID